MSAHRKLLYHDADRCMGCHACEVACKAEHDLPIGVNRVRIVTQGPNLTDGKLTLSFKRIACQHCPNPPCARVCPTLAIQKRADGIVFIEHSLCTGCQSCASVCPYNAIQFNPHKNWAEICDLCADRLDQGLAPFCLQHCMGGDLFFGTREEFQRRKERGVRNGS